MLRGCDQLRRAVALLAALSSASAFAILPGRPATAAASQPRGAAPRLEDARGREFVKTDSGLAGQWVLDRGRSESMTDFLVSVGAPRLVAMAAAWVAKPVRISAEAWTPKGAGPVTVQLEVEGRPAEIFCTAGPARVETRGGAVSATLSVADLPESFTVTKQGPAPAEVTTELRELLAEGQGAMRCTLTHQNPRTGRAVTVVQHYVRA